MAKNKKDNEQAPQPRPHANWAKFYDFVYENDFGPMYQGLTDQTMEIISQVLSPSASIIDFGAGTGRLSIPLASRGYHVTAVEPCGEMIGVLETKAAGAGVLDNISRIKQSMQDYSSQGQFDLAICVFSTISYVTGEQNLKSALTNIAECIKPGGHILIEIPPQIYFQDRQRRTNILDRNVQVTSQGGDIYTYYETTCCRLNGEWQSYQALFSIRYWTPDQIWNNLHENGVICETVIQIYGSSYCVGLKN